jgi:DNA primase
MSFGGGMSDTQKDEITRILGAFSGEIVIATDNDKAGEKFFEFFKSVRSDVIRDRPVRKDWNDDLKDQCLNRINADNLREMR